MRSLLFVRHEAAENIDAALAAGRTEEERRLTEDGIRMFRKAALQIAVVHDELDLVLHSPLVRARQTAELLVEMFPGASMNDCESLSPGMQFVELVKILNQTGKDSIALVGHEPDFSQAISDAICAKGSARIDVKKGSAILVNFGDQFAEATGCLAWSITAAQLNKFAQ